MSRPIGYLFPGQGSQFVGMGKTLYEAFPQVHELYEQASEILGYDIASLCFEGPSERLNLTEFTQPALLMTSMAALRALGDTGIAPAAVAGHSLGEYSALAAAQYLTIADAMVLVQKRARYMSEAVPPGSGLVAAVLGLSGSVVEEACRDAQALGVVSPVNFNCPGQIVIAGEKAAVERAMELLKQRGCRRVLTLPVSVPVHTSLMQSAADRLSQSLESVSIAKGTAPVINNVEAKALHVPEDIRISLVRQLPSPVLWEQSMKVMWEMGITTFIEIGPGTVLTGLAKRIVPEATLLNIQDPASLDVTLQHLNEASV